MLGMTDSVNSFPRFIIFDTCCFLEALDKRDNAHFDYERIKADALKSGSMITITAYSLYELIQGLRKVKRIEEFRNKLISVGDCYIWDNTILKHKGLEYGIDYLFFLKLHSNETIHEFADEQDSLRGKTYNLLFGKMFFFASLVAASYVYLLECDSNCELNNDAAFRVDFILNHFMNYYDKRYRLLFSNVFEHVGYYVYDLETHETSKDFDARDHLREYLTELILEMIAISEVELSMVKQNPRPDNNHFNQRIIEKLREMSPQINQSCFKKLNKNIKAKSNGKVTIERVLDKMPISMPDDLHKEAFVFLVKRLFNSGGFGGSINNDFIDLSNIVAMDSFNVGEAVSLTYEYSVLG